uniref:Uncharacterized protein n=1 Tax=Varanus komodoensis TaxID=61221 RepID=A0A8D2IUY1_VARKO
MGMKQGSHLWILLLLCSFCKSKTRVQTAQHSAVSTSQCSAWGHFHFQTFDQVKFDFPGTCHYIFASHCKDNYQDFKIQITRSTQNRIIIYFTATIDGVLLEVKESGITVDGSKISLPFSLKSVLIEDIYPYFQISSKLGLSLRWNWGDTLLMDLEDAYRGKTCGLCGNYDGDGRNDLLLHTFTGFPLSPWQFGNLQKVDDPARKCPDVLGDSRKNQGKSHLHQQCKSRYKSKCKRVLSHFGNCSRVVAIGYYISSCTEDMCSCPENASHLDLVASCVCSTFGQYSRDCILKGGNPGKWRSKGLCFQQCPNNLEYTECGNACVDTCFNPERSKSCTAPCTDGCFCPKGSILDDISGRSCIATDRCPCTFQGNIYAAGDSYSTPCQNCTCTGGKWSCLLLPCSGNCKIEGGCHITTFDKKQFMFHGNCHYVLAKDTEGAWVVIGEIVQCSISNTTTCLKNVLITLEAMVIRISSSGKVYVDNVIAVLPVTKDGIILFRPSTFYVNIITSLRVEIQVQLTPIMQIFITVDQTYQNHVSGLCGNFNNVEMDEFQTISGIIEDSASAFGNSWKTMASCADVRDSFEDPCQNHVEREKIGQRWCALLLDTNGGFAPCHSVSDPAPYAKNCLYDTCNAEKSKEALCGAFSAYARDCAARGIRLNGWRNGICDVSTECPGTMKYYSEVQFCNRSCRSLSEPDVLCNLQIAPAEGCGCPEGTYLVHEEECVALVNCPCYYQDLLIQPGNSFQKDGTMCKCIQGQLDCTGNKETRKDCPPPMYFVDCGIAGSNARGSECQKSCKTQDMQCHATGCVSGCVCPDGLVSDGNGKCIKEEQCPCSYGGNFYSPGTYIKVNCNTCTCQKRQWDCTENACPGTCTVYGHGHYLSFDGVKFDFTGGCDYILAQDFCPNNLQPGTFQILMQNTACSKSLTVCSLKIRIILEDSEIRLREGKIEEISSKPDTEKNYDIYLVGMHIAIEAFHGVTFLWDGKTTVVVQAAPSFQGRLCGLCGDFDNRAGNDFATRGQSLEMHAQAFGSGWQVTPGCSDRNQGDPCAQQAFKIRLGQKHCSIIKSTVFAPCHSKINPTPYYESCVSDFCGCDSVSDCERFCTAVAAYSWTCSRAGICINWRSQKNCPVSCDDSNAAGKQVWRYKPCGEPCFRTCRNPAGKCDKLLYSLEGCYPECNGEKPYYDEEKRECVSGLECTSCDPEEKLCLNHSNECLCCYNKKTYAVNEIVYSQTAGDVCTVLFCGPGGNFIQILTLCDTPLKDVLHAGKQDMAPLMSLCFCNISGQLLSRGNSQYITKEAPGWCIYALCNASCQTEFSYGECLSFSTDTTPSKIVVASSRPCKVNVQDCEKKPPPYSGVNVLPALAPGGDCTDLIPPRKAQELWKFGSCQMATCLGGKHIHVSDVRCPPPKIQSCVNGLPPVKRQDAPGCCEALECQCACNGWGNQHYITFDGSYYNFRGNCTYLLMKPIRPDAWNFWIYMDNHYCAPSYRAICSMALFIFYNHSIVILTQGAENGKEGNLVLYNNKEIIPPFSMDGFDITASGPFVMVKIPETGLHITYTHLAFYLNVPFSTFYNNTEGQCGTCTNERGDDALKRNGRIANSLTEMAKDWKVMDLFTRYCSSEQHRTQAERNFTACHNAVPPQPYYDACVADGCASSPEQHTECGSLWAYAALCGFHGICVDWRSKASKKCGEKNDARTTPTQRDMIPEVLLEGCFCPDGMIQLNHYDSICVPVCGKEMESVGKRETWEKDCQVCTCSTEMLEIYCSPHICAKSQPITCTKEGFAPVVRTQSEDPCCTEVACECDARSCRLTTRTCSPGFQMVTDTSEGECCPVYSCSNPPPSPSHFPFKPGSLVPSNSCEECLCTDTQDPATDVNQITCTPVKCSAQCQQGFRYIQEEGKCCGACVQVACVAKLSSGTVAIEVGETYKDPKDNCTQYRCTRSSDQFVLSHAVIPCQAFDPSNCVPGTIRTTPDGCCETCALLSHDCGIKLKNQHIIYNSCKSAFPIMVPSCKGSCNTYSVYSFVTHKMEHGCTCCRATKYHEVRVDLICSRRKRIKYTYLHVDECGCVDTICAK